jgi:hypothetical protein
MWNKRATAPGNGAFFFFTDIDFRFLVSDSLWASIYNALYIFIFKIPAKANPSSLILYGDRFFMRFSARSFLKDNPDFFMWIIRNANCVFVSRIVLGIQKDVIPESKTQTPDILLVCAVMPETDLDKWFSSPFLYLNFQTIFDNEFIRFSPLVI